MHVASFSSQKAQWGKTILKQQKQKQIELSHYSQDPLGPGQQQRPLRTWRNPYKLWPVGQSFCRADTCLESSKQWFSMML